MSWSCALYSRLESDGHPQQQEYVGSHGNHISTTIHLSKLVRHQRWHQQQWYVHRLQCLTCILISYRITSSLCWSPPQALCLRTAEYLTAPTATSSSTRFTDEICCCETRPDDRVKCSFVQFIKMIFLFGWRETEGVTRSEGPLISWATVKSSFVSTMISQEQWEISDYLQWVNMSRCLQDETAEKWNWKTFIEDDYWTEVWLDSFSTLTEYMNTEGTCVYRK